MKTLGLPLIKETCEDPLVGGILSLTPCPKAHAVGTCDTQQDVRIHYYSVSARPFSAATAREACEGGDKPGKFKAVD